MKLLNKANHLKWSETKMIHNSPRIYGFAFEKNIKIELVQFLENFPLISYVADTERSNNVSMYGLVMLTTDNIDYNYIKENFKTNELIRIYRELELKSKMANTPLQIVLTKVDVDLNLLEKLHTNLETSL